MPALDLVDILIGFLVLLFSLTVHELAHAWTADRLGDSTARLLGRVSLNPLVHIDPIGTVLFPLIAMLSGIPLIGWAKPVPVRTANLRHHRRDYVLVAAAGPVSNLILASIASLANRTLSISPTSTLNPTYLALEMIQINVLLAVFNMIPIPPLDGGNVLAGVLPPRVAFVFHALRPYGFLVIYGMVLTNTLSLLIGPPYYLLLSWLR